MDWVNVLTAVMGVAVIVVGGFVGLQQGTVRTLRESNKDLRDRIGDLEKRVTEVLADNSTLTADRDALARVVTGEVHWVALGSQLETHHREATAHWEHVARILGRIHDDLRSGDTQ